MIELLDPNIYQSQSYVALDFETTNLDKGSALNHRNDTVVACWYKVQCGRIQRHFKVGGIHEMVELVNDIQSTDFLLVQSAQFELKWLRRAGLDLHNVVIFDTLLAEYVLAGNRFWDKDLDSIARRCGVKQQKSSYISTCIKAGICPSTLPLSKVIDYCYRDIEIMYRVFQEQLAQLLELGQTHLVYQRCMTAVMLADVAFNGMCLDKDVVYTMYREEMIRMGTAMDALRELSDGVNWNSHPQVRQFVYEDLGLPYPTDWRGEPILTDTGLVTTKAELIAELHPSTPEQQGFIDVWGEYTQSHGRLSKTLQFFKGVVDEYDCLFKAAIKQGGSATHRLTSSGMPLYIKEFDRTKSTQFQNIDTTLKRAICARHDGWFIGDTDGAGLEMRAAIELARDLQGYQDIITNHDFHSFTAQELLGPAFIQGDKDQRRRAKRDTFKPLYYGKSGTPEQRRYYAAFRRRYPDIESMQEGWIETVAEERELVLPYGMRYYWPDVEIYESGFVKYSNSICNYPCQGFATAELIPLAVVQTWHELDKQGCQSFLVNTVHDSVVAEVHPDERNEYLDISKRAMSDDLYGLVHTLYDYEFATPLGTETCIGEHWGEGDEVKYESKTPFKFRPRTGRLSERKVND